MGEYSAEYSAEYAPKYSKEYSAEYAPKYFKEYSAEYAPKYSKEYSAEYAPKYSKEYSAEYCSIDNVIEKLKTDGVAVIPNIISLSKIKSYQNQLWDMLNHLTQKLETPIKKDDIKTWKTIYELYPNYNMLLHRWGIGHSKLCWGIRQEQKVIDVFSHIWKVKPDELLTSFDGMSIHFPHEITKRGHYTGEDWFHTDQSQLKKDFCCVQGMVTLFDINEGDATFRCMKKSNNFHSQFFEKYDIKSKGDWYKLNEETSSYFDKFEKCSIIAEKGSLILWDSRTFHQGIESRIERKIPNIRNVIYVSMLPRNTATEYDLKKKRKAFNKKRTTSHWSNKSRLFSKLPNTCGKKLPEITNVNDEIILSNIGKRLAGF